MSTTTYLRKDTTTSDDQAHQEVNAQSADLDLEAQADNIDDLPPPSYTPRPRCMCASSSHRQLETIHEDMESQPNNYQIWEQDLVVQVPQSTTTTTHPTVTTTTNTTPELAGNRLDLGNLNLPAPLHLLLGDKVYPLVVVIVVMVVVILVVILVK